jgi:polyhydroxyalkanoate synthesis regulator phasin
MTTDIPLKTVKITKYNKLISVFDELTRQLQLIQDEKLQKQIDFLLQMPEQLTKFLAQKNGITKSKLAVGLEQALREMPECFSDLKPEVRIAALKAWNTSIKNNFPDFLEKDKEKLSKILSKGHIRNESEYYLIRNEVDALEGDDSQRELLIQYYEFLEKFESM